jgi:SAM-dependent methyltransferase
MLEPAIGYEKSAKYYDFFADNTDLPFFVELAKSIETAGTVLDLGAGTGRVTYALAKAGFSVWALERSPAMLAVAKGKLARMPPAIAERVHLIEADMSAFTLNKRFPLIIVPQSFSHCLTTEQQIACLRCIRQHLTEEGICVLDIFQGSTFSQNGKFEDPPRCLDSKRTIKRSGKYEIDPTTQLICYHLQYEIFEGDCRIEEIKEYSCAALIYPREATLLIRLSGLSILAEYGDWKKRPYEASSKIRILLLKQS